VTLPGGDRAVSISAFYAGPVEEGERALRPLRKALPPLEDRIRPIPYVELQRAGDATFPRGDRFYWKAQFVRNIPDAAIDLIIERYPAAPSPRSLFVFQQVGGAIARAPADQSAYANRDAAFDAFPVSIWSDPALDEANVAWASATYEAVRPFGTNGVYVNNLGDEGEERVRAAYGANYGRLAALKRKFDPDNLFRANQNVQPAV
jgi:FAD/FMN-containing dehydrogenase